MKWCDECKFFVRREDERCELCGQDRSHTEPLVDQRFRLGSKLGSGGMGAVYSAIDVTLERRAAVKFLHAQATPVTAQRVQQFRREASAIAAVRSEHVAALYSFGLHDRQPFFAMEFVEGVTLASLVAPSQARTLSPLRALAIVRDIAVGLSAVHAAGLVHCDVKPSNIVIEEGTGRAVLVDFGIATLAGSFLGDELDIAGTPGYMAPEQAIPQHVIVPATDVYALGCTLFEALTGRLPFVAPSVVRLMMSHVNDTPPAPSSIEPTLAPVDALVARALEKVPARRFPTALAFAHAIDAIIAEFERRPSAEPTMDNATAPVGLRALVIDDDPMLARLAARAIETAFRGIDIVIDVANSGDEALERWQMAPDLVVLDLHMPGRDGTETLASLRERRNGAQLRAIAWTARPVPEAVRKFKALGVEQVLAKPLTFQHLVGELKAIGLKSGWILPEPAVPPTRVNEQASR
ncbi:MAG: protein kinase [Myxococcales bacterium]|nr:protein kinase [Myxococcales bacterium]